MATVYADLECEAYLVAGRPSRAELDKLLDRIVMPCLQKLGPEKICEAIRDRLVAACREISDALL